MAAAAEAVLGNRVTLGVAVAQAPAARRLVRTPLLLASHPLPDARGLRAARAVEAAVCGLGKDDVVLALLSGGASALLPAPVRGISLRDKQLVTARLLRAGASIGEINTVRKHLSRLKGGGLARLAQPAEVRALVLSDVVDDDLSTIASGPLSPDPTTYRDALGVLHGHRILIPRTVLQHLEAGAMGRATETPKPGDPAFDRVRVRIVGSNRLVRHAAAAEARRRGFRTRIVDDRLEGEARVAGVRLAERLRREAARLRPGTAPVCLIAGGETTVKVRGTGRGGRNLELVTAAAAVLATAKAAALVASMATDGLDGNSGASGGFVDSSTTSRAERMGLAAPERFLDRNDTASFLEPLGDLIRTGPTGTNLLDLTLLLAGRGPTGHGR